MRRVSISTASPRSPCECICASCDLINDMSLSRPGMRCGEPSPYGVVTELTLAACLLCCNTPYGVAGIKMQVLIVEIQSSVHKGDVTASRSGVEEEETYILCTLSSMLEMGTGYTCMQSQLALCRTVAAHGRIVKRVSLSRMPKGVCSMYPAA